MKNKIDHMKKITCVIILAFIGMQLIAQSFEVPKNVNLMKAEDYKQYEEAIVKGTDWLLNTPINSEQAKRKEVNAFLMKWMTGSPDVSLEMNADVLTFMECPDCLMMFLAGWTKLAIQSDTKVSNVEGSIQGVKDVIALYQKNKAYIGKNKAIEKYIKLDNKGKLETYLASKLK